MARFLDKWLETYCATNTTLRTQQGYREKLYGYVIPTFGNVELQKLTPQQIQKIYAGMLEAGLRGCVRCLSERSEESKVLEDDRSRYFVVPMESGLLSITLDMCRQVLGFLTQA